MSSPPSSAANNRENPALSSFQTAIAIIPPPFLHPQINSLRSLYDKSYKKWPAHINVLYPFVAPERLDSAVRTLRDIAPEAKGFNLELDRPGNFRHRQNATVFLSPGPHDGGTVEHPETVAAARLRALEGLLAGPFERVAKTGLGDGTYRPHLTVGQTSLDSTAMDSLMSKAGKLCGGGIGWFVSRLAVLKRDEDGNMNIVDEIQLGGASGDEVEDEAAEGMSELDISNQEFPGIEGQRSTYRYSPETEDWTPIDRENPIPPSRYSPKEITIATYNCLIDSPFPPPLERYPLLLNSILSIHPTPPSSALPSILCLQEVTDEFLPYLLSNPHIQSRYPFCTHSPESVLPSIRNCIILASHACGPFDWEWIDFTKRHKGAVVASFPRLGTAENPLVVAVVHLTCGLTDGSVAAKMSQLKTLTSHLQTRWSDSEWIVAGDFNLPTSKHTIANAFRNRGISQATYEMVKEGLVDHDVFSDVWELCFGENEEDGVPYEAEDIAGATQKDGESGATFNPLTNPLAADRVQWSADPRPQRYDRILVRRLGKLGVRDIKRFGFPEVDAEKGPVCGSDHWGLRAVLNIHPDAEAGQSAADKLELLPVDIDDQTLKKFVEGLMPSKEDYQIREAAIKTLKGVLEQEQRIRTDTENTPSRAAFPIVLVPVGSYMLDVYDKNSDVDCLCLSTISIKTFFQVARQRIKKFGGDRGVKIVRFVNAKVPMMELKVGDIKMDLQYCQAPNLVEHWADVPLLPPDSFIFNLPASTLKRLNAYRDAEYLLRTLPNLKVFRLAHRFIKLWTKTAGISSSRFGYLGGFHITLLLARVCKLADTDPKEITAAKIVRLFFDYYARFDWTGDIVSDPVFAARSRYQRFPREAMVLASIHTPVINVAQTATRHSVKVLSREFKVADEALRNGQWDLKSLAREDGFVGEYQSFIKIDVQFWGNSAGKGKALTGWVESRVPLLLVDLNSRVPSIHARVWPQRFVNTDDTEDWTELRGFYLVGLSNEDTQAHTDPQKAKDHKREIENKFLDVIRSFEEVIRDNAAQYDTADSWVRVQHVGKASLGSSLRVDDRDWGEGSGGSDVDELDDEEDVLSEEDERFEGEDEYVSKKDKKKASAKKQPVSVPGRKLRPAGDVISRIRWDPSLDARDFVIGYEDRFLGTRETEIEKWKTEQTDLEFIPMHRVVYFKRKSDGVLVWDRETKKDLLFGVEWMVGVGVKGCEGCER